MVRSSRAQSRGVESQVSAAKGGGRFAKLPSFAPKYEMARRSKTLHMSMLSLTAVPSEVWNIAGLVRLDLGHNELPRLPPSVAQLSGLEQLWLNHNPLDDLPAEIELCKKLKVLDLRHTRLRRVPRELGRLKHLIEIELTDTPLGESLHLTPTSVKVEGAASGVAKEVPLYAGPLDTEQLMQHLAVKDKRDTLQAEMLEKVCGGTGGSGSSCCSRTWSLSASPNSPTSLRYSMVLAGNPLTGVPDVRVCYPRRAPVFERRLASCLCSNV